MLRRLIHRSTPPEGCEPIRAGTELLATRQEKVKAIAALAGVPPSVFQACYWEALVAYAAFVQTMPVSPELPDHNLLDEGLGQAIRALNRRRGYLLPAGAEAETIAAEADSWTYAVFLASLFQGIGKVTIDRKVTMFDKKHRCLGCWEPWAGAMAMPAIWYQVSFTPNSNADLANRLAPLLVPHIVPAAGLTWLWPNSALIASWVNAISGDVRSAGILAEIIALPGKLSDRPEPNAVPHSSAVSQEAVPPIEPHRAPLSKFSGDAEIGDTPQIEKDDCQAAGRDAGLADPSDDPGHLFLNWLREGLDKGSLSNNPAGALVHRVPEGLLLVSPDIFQQYDAQRWQDVQKRFLKLKLHTKSGPGNNFFTYRVAENPSLVISGLLIVDAKILLGDRPLPPITHRLIRDNQRPL